MPYIVEMTEEVRLDGGLCSHGDGDSCDNDATVLGILYDDWRDVRPRCDDHPIEEVNRHWVPVPMADALFVQRLMVTEETLNEYLQKLEDKWRSAEAAEKADLDAKIERLEEAYLLVNSAFRVTLNVHHPWTSLIDPDEEVAVAETARQKRREKRLEGRRDLPGGDLYLVEH